MRNRILALSLVLTVLAGIALAVPPSNTTLFVRSDEVEASWKLWDPLLGLAPALHPYRAGTWGPAAMDQGVALGGDEWMDR